MTSGKLYTKWVAVGASKSGPKASTYKKAKNLATPLYATVNDANPSKLCRHQPAILNGNLWCSYVACSGEWRMYAPLAGFLFTIRCYIMKNH